MGPVTDQWNMYYTCWVDCRIEPRAIVLPIPPPNTSSPGDRVSFTITISPAYQLFWLAMCFLLLLLSTCQCLHIFQLFLIFLSFCLTKRFVMNFHSHWRRNDTNEHVCRFIRKTLNSLYVKVHYSSRFTPRYRIQKQSTNFTSKNISTPYLWVVSHLICGWFPTFQCWRSQYVNYFRLAIPGPLVDTYYIIIL